jgi:hypothetical protein
MAAEFSSVQPLPTRPGAMAAQPVRPKGQVTAGRPLPPRAGESAAVATQTTVAELAPVTVAAAPASPVASAPAAPPVVQAPLALRATKPDPRPMRIAFGAGAVAAVSALTIGMVKPDFAASLTGAESTDAGTAEAAKATTDVSVRHVTDYVLLEPGEKAPRGATVISADELLGLTDGQPDPRQPNDGGRADGQHPRDRSATKPGSQATDTRASGRQEPAADAPAAEPDQKAPAQAERQPAPKPDPGRVSTRQSGS